MLPIRHAARLAAAFALALPFAALAQPTPLTPPPPAEAPAPTAPASPITLELNKLEPLPAGQPGGPGCRVYMVTSNPAGPALETLRLDLVIFGTDGVISHRVAVDLGPLPAKKTSVRLFDLAGQNCDDIGRMLVNDVMLCTSTGADGTPDQQRAACLTRLQPTSRTKAQLTK
jgi:hypothetical protein